MSATVSRGSQGPTGPSPFPFDVTNPEYGSAGDGVADDRPAIQAAIDATAGKGIVYLPAGDYLLNTTGPNLLPADADGLVIKGAGRGLTRVILTATCPGFLTFDRTADHQTFQNITVEDLTVDADNVSSELATIIGSVKADRTIQQRINLDNIVVRRVNSINVPVDRAGTPTDIRRNICLVTYQPDATPEATQNTITNIQIEDVDLRGGLAGVEVFGSSPLTTYGTNIYLDNIKVYRARHSSLTAPSTAIAGSSVHIGSKGFGGSCIVRDCYSEYSGDVGVEINAMTRGLVEGCEVLDSAGPSMFHTNYNYPAIGGGGAPSPSNTTIDKQRVSFVNCHVSRLDFTPTGSQAGYRTSTNYSLPIGAFEIRDSSYSREGTGADCQADAIAFTATARAFTVDGFSASVTGLSTGTNTDEVLIRLRDGSVGETILRNIKTKVEATQTAGTPKIKSLEVGTGSFATKLLIDNYSIEFDLTSWTGPAYGMLIGNDTATLSASEISRVRLIDWAGVPGSAWVGIYIGGSNLTITDRLLITNCDLINAGAGSDIDFVSSPTNINKVYVRDINWSSTPFSSSVASAATVTLPLGRRYYAITGTTGISSITASYVDHVVSLKFTDATPGTVTDGSNLNLAGNFVPTTSDVLTLVCDGTNWNEISRSAN